MQAPAIVTMSFFKLGDYLLLTRLLQQIEAKFPYTLFVIPDALFELYVEQKVFNNYISRQNFEQIQLSNRFEILDLTFPLIEKAVVPDHFHRLGKEFFYDQRHVYYNYRAALQVHFGEFADQQDLAEPFLELNPNHDILSKHGLKLFKYFTVHAGSDYAPKNWDPKNFEQTVVKLLSKYPELTCVSIVGPKDDELFIQNKPSRFQTVKTDLTEVSHILSGSLFHVDNDSGIHHLAGALNIPSITVFGPTGPGSWASVTPFNFIHWGGPNCSDHCGGLRMSECQSRICLDSVQVDSVVGSAHQILAQYTHLSV